MRTATVVATLDGPKSAGDVAVLSRIANWLEVRIERDADWLRAHFDGPLLYRGRRPREAARSFNFVALQESDLAEGIPPEQRVITWRGCASSVRELRDRLQTLTQRQAHLYVLELTPRTVAEQLLPLELLREIKRDDVVAYCGGVKGVWTRPLAARLGAPFIFGRAGDDYGDDGTPPVARLADDFCLPELWPVRELFAMAGDPVTHSLSPRIHNNGYRAVGRDTLYVPFQVGDFAEFWNDFVETGRLDRLGFPLRGISVVSPYKAVAVAAAVRRSEMVERARSTNLLRRDDDGWYADTTDADGVMLTLRDHSVTCRNRRAAVIGCGGSGRAMAAALSDAGADVTLVNRGFERGSLAVHLLRMPFMPLSSFSAEPYSIFVNATPVGRDSDDMPFAIDSLPRDAVIVDLTYRHGATSLIRRTRGPGRITIDGMEMLLAQAARQFNLMTGEELPEGLARQAVGLSSERFAAEQR